MQACGALDRLFNYRKVYPQSGKGLTLTSGRDGLLLDQFLKASQDVSRNVWSINRPIITALTGVISDAHPHKWIGALNRNQAKKSAIGAAG